MQHWESVPTWLMEEAGHDLATGADMARPCLVAFRGASPLFVAFLREFAKGEYRAPLRELAALAAPLDADRLAFAVTARAWSLDESIPLSADGTDLRQRVLVIEIAEAAGGDDEAGRGTSTLVPFDDPIPGQPVRWGKPETFADGDGWISEALRIAVSPRMRAALRCDDAEIARQAWRVDALGHLLALAPEVLARLEAVEHGRGRAGSARGRRAGRQHRWVGSAQAPIGPP